MAGALPLSIGGSTIWMLAYALGVGAVCILLVLRTYQEIMAFSNREDPGSHRRLP